jgi:hypothetical protein
MSKKTRKTVSVERSTQIERMILLVRGHKVMLDRDLAALYDVETKALNQAVKRNLDRFPEDFMFELTWEEVESLPAVTNAMSERETRLRSQSVTLKRGQHMKYRPRVFTEQGVAMLSSVLRSKRAVNVNIEVMRAFVRLRSILAAHADLARRLDELEAKYDKQFAVVFEAIRGLMAQPDEPTRGRIGFRRRSEG